MVQWNAENDRTFFLKVIETHGISLDYKKIASAWPADSGDKPTAKALSERFGKLRKLAGVLGTPVRSTVSTPAKPRVAAAPKTPKSSAKKRKIQEEDSESDAEDYLTEEDTPTRKGKSSQRGRAATGGGVLIKQEALDKSFDTFNKNHHRANQLQASFNDPFGMAPSGTYGNGYGGNFDQNWNGMGGGFDGAGDSRTDGHGTGNLLSTPTANMQLGQRIRSSRQAAQKAPAAWKDEADSNGLSDEASVSDFQDDGAYV